MDIPLHFRPKVDKIILDVKQSLIRRVVDMANRVDHVHSVQLRQSVWQRLVSELAKHDFNPTNGPNLLPASSSSTNVQHQIDLSSVEAQLVSNKGSSTSSTPRTRPTILLETIDGKDIEASGMFIGNYN